jgi:nitrous oxide reductase
VRSLLTAGLVAAATVLGTCAAVPAAQATTSTGPGARAAGHSVAYPSGVAPAATAAYDQLWGVSCVHAGDCVAVGVNSNADAVSCPVAKFCLIGGYYATSADRDALLAVRWDGAHFGLVTVPSPATASNFDNLISGVSCTSSTSCAVDGIGASFPALTGS